jgi:hypothetical protein
MESEYSNIRESIEKISYQINQLRKATLTIPQPSKPSQNSKPTQPSKPSQPN